MPNVLTKNERTRAAADPRLLHPLDRLRGTIRRYVALDGLLAAALVVVAWFWLGLVLDFVLFKLTAFDWALDAPRFLRGVALVGMLVLLALVVALRIGSRLTKQFSYPSLALLLEKRFPKLLGDRLITAVELADVARAGRQGYSEQMIRETIAAARERIEQVPLNTVFRWGRLWNKAIVIGAVCVVGLLMSFVLFAVINRTASPIAFANRSTDVVSIWVERNVLLMNTPWPRRAHLELVAVPESGIRVGKDAPPPKVTVRAFQWVIADRGIREGWRPLAWADLARFGATPPESLTVSDELDIPAERVAAAGVVGGVGLPVEKPVVQRTVKLTEMSVDAIATEFGTNHPALGDLFAVLDREAEKSSNSRKLRKLEAPNDVVLVYRGKPAADATGRVTLGSTRGDVKFAPEKPGEFTAEVSNLKESVAFVVRAADFRTDSRDIILVPPPMLTRFTRTESQPAYLYHPAPAAAGPPNFAPLAGLRQTLAEKDLSLTGDKSICTIPAGTDLVLTGIADKPLKAVALQPRVGRVPGQLPDSTAPIAVPVTEDKFSVRFVGPDRLTQTVEFELVLIDLDGVTATRPVVVQVVDDKAPQVEVGIDVLRKVGNAYLCTTRARVPFVKESSVRDDTGLSRLEFQFAVSRVEAAVVVGLQAQAIATVWANPPLVPGVGSTLGPAVGAFLTAQLGKGEQKQFGALPAAPFDRAYDLLPRATMASLTAALATPPANPDAAGVVKEVKFNLESDAFDLVDADALLETRGRKMRVTDPGDVQPRYRVELTIVATDVNVETGPKQGRNLDPIRLLVVSEADLLAEISKDEEGLIGKLDEALRKLRDSQSKLSQQSERLISTNPPPDIILSARVRAEDIMQDVGKARDLTTAVASEYGRLKREVETNRCNESVPKRYESVIIRPLEEVLTTEFKQAEDGLAGFRDPLIDGRRPDDIATVTARNTLATLILRLAQIRAQLGEALSESRLRDDLRKIIENQKLVTEALERGKKRLIDSLFAPKIKPLPTVVLARGEKKVLRHGIDWNVFDKGEIKIRIEVPNNSGLQAPTELTVTDDKNDFAYELSAGQTVGEFTVRLTPSVGEPVEVKVTVK